MTDAIMTIDGTCGCTNADPILCACASWCTRGGLGCICHAIAEADGLNVAATMTVEDTFTIKGRGLVLAGHPGAEPAMGMVARLADGRAWVVRGVERQGIKRWHTGDPSAVLIGDAGDAPPQICDVVELVGESPAASTEPEGPRVVAGVTVYLDGKRLTENVEFSVLGKESAWADMRRQAAIMRDELAEFAFHVKRLGLIDENGEPTS